MHRSPHRPTSPFLRARRIAAIDLLLLLALAAPAAAQSADAEALFAEAERLEAADRLDEACDTFEASNRIDPRAGTMIRLGDCRAAQGRLASAWSAYKDSLTRARDPRKRELAERRVAELEPRLSYLTISVPDESRIDGLAITRNDVGLDPALWNRAVPVDGGTYVISGQAPGHEPWSTSKVVAEADARVAVEIPRFKALRALAPGPAPGAATDQPPAARGLGGRRRIALAAAGVGLAAIAAGVGFGMQARGREDDAYALCPEPGQPCADAAAASAHIADARSRAMYANLGYGTGAAALAGAAILWLTGGRADSPRRARLTSRPTPGGFAVDLAVRF